MIRHRTGTPATEASPLGKAIAALLLTLTSACATHTPAMQNDTAVREFAAKGYAALERDSATSTKQTWTVAGQAVTFVLAKPVRAGSIPIVIYLPGLGEPSESGENWRTAWSAAGYAVISVQLLDDDASAWRSALAREGEFKELGRQHYAGAIMARRMRLLADLLEEGKRRSTAGDAPWRQLDWNKVAVAGFDLGAYTAMAAAGERIREAEDVRERLQIRAAIALSPYASLAGGSVDGRYRDIRAPVMSITSDADSDPLGLVESASLRNAPFDRMDGPDKYLLSLQGLPHAGLSGNADATAPASNSNASKRSQGSGAGTGSDDSGRHRRGGKRGGGTGDDAGPGRERSSNGAGMASRDLSAGATRMRIIATQDLSTAFLDAYVKDDALAREWLNTDAGRWLGAIGQLRRK